MSYHLAKIMMIFFANFLCRKENRGFAANNVLSNIFKYNFLNILTKSGFEAAG